MIDILIITALREELDALLTVSAGLKTSWRPVAGDPPHHEAAFEGRHGAITIAAARATGMTARHCGPLATRLIERLKPHGLAMCGVCAGKPGDTSMGDVVIADRVYQYDDGKRTTEGFYGDQNTFALRDQWLRVAQDMIGPARILDVFAEAPETWSAEWLLDRLSRGFPGDLRAGIARYFPDPASSGEVLKKLRHGGLLMVQAGTLCLSPEGEKAVEEYRLAEFAPIDSAPIQVHVGPMASGNAVQADPRVWEELKTSQRKTLAIEMEAAGLATVAHTHGLPFVVAKGVMDHADAHKRDGFKGLAAQASAGVLVHLLREVVARPTTISPSTMSVADRHVVTPKRPELPNYAEFESLMAGLERLRAQFHLAQPDEGQLLRDAEESYPGLEFNLTKSASGRQLLVRPRAGLHNVGIDVGQLAFPETDAGRRGEAKYRALIEHGHDVDLLPGEYQWTRHLDAEVFDYVERDVDPAHLQLSLRARAPDRAETVYLRVDASDHPPLRITTTRRLVRRGTVSETFELSGGEFAGRMLLTRYQPPEPRADGGPLLAIQRQDVTLTLELKGASLKAVDHTLRLLRSVLDEAAVWRIESIEGNLDPIRLSAPRGFDLGGITASNIDFSLLFVEALRTIARSLRQRLVYRAPSRRDIQTAFILAHALGRGPVADSDWHLTLGVPTDEPRHRMTLQAEGAWPPDLKSACERLLEGPIAQLSFRWVFGPGAGYMLFGQRLETGPPTVILGNARLAIPADDAQQKLANGEAFPVEIEFDTFGHAFPERHAEAAPVAAAGPTKPGRPTDKKLEAQRRRAKRARKARRQQRKQGRKR